MALLERRLGSRVTTPDGPCRCESNYSCLCQASSFSPFLRYFQPFSSPQTAGPYVARVPAISAKKSNRNAEYSVAVSAHDTLDILRFRRLTEADARRYAFEKALPVSLVDMLQHLNVQSGFATICFSQRFLSSSSFSRRASSACMPPYCLRQRS